MFDTANKHDKDREVEHLGKWASTVGYSMGFLAGASTVGLLAGLILGVYFILEHSKNEALKNQTQAVSKRVQNNQISLTDLDKIAGGERISNRECVHTAIFIDGLEQKLGCLKNGQKVGENYIFIKTIDPNGIINYRVEDSQTNQITASFDLDTNGQIALQSRHNTEAIAKLNEFVILNADKAAVNVNADISLYSDEAIQAGVVAQAIQSVETSMGFLNRVDLTRLATGSESAQSQYLESQDQLKQQLAELAARAQVIRDQIHTAEVANDKESQRHPANTLLGIKVSCLVNKLVGLDQQIERLQTELQGKPQTLTELQAYRTVKVESTAPDNEIDALNHQISKLQAQVKVLTPVSPASRQQSAQSVSLKDRQQPRSEDPLKHGSFSEAQEYPDLPADLQDLASESYGNGQPIILVAPESPDEEVAQGMAQ
jgi:hypothetical protein